MTRYRDAIAATLSLVLGVAAMAGVVATDLYAQAASADSAVAAPAILAINEARP
jgi:hypothetical protein